MWFGMSALRGSRTAASLSQPIAAFQSPAAIACLPAAKSGSSSAQSTFAVIDSMVLQIGQASAALAAAESVAPASVADEGRGAGVEPSNSVAAAATTARAAPNSDAKAIDR